MSKYKSVLNIQTAFKCSTCDIQPVNKNSKEEFKTLKIKVTNGELQNIMKCKVRNGIYTEKNKNNNWY